jgi:hypothetical protein
MACVYGHIRKDTNEIFYIGIGKEIKRAYSKKYRNDHWNNIVNKSDYDVIIIKSDLSWDEACELEKYYIKKIGRYDLSEGNLVNKTEGGEGVNGHSEELKKVLRNHRLGKKMSEEQKKKISEANKNRVFTDEHKSNLSESLKKRKLSDEHKEKIGSSMKGKLLGDKNPNYGKKTSPETIEKLKNKAKNRQKVQCPFCEKKIDITVAKRFHFDNCNNKRSLIN